MKKYYVGDGYFHQKKWVNGINMPTSKPGLGDEIIIDNRSKNIRFGFKTKVHQFFYNLKIVFIIKSFKYWNEIVIGGFDVITTGVVTIDYKFNILENYIATYVKGTVNINPKLSKNNNG